MPQTFAARCRTTPGMQGPPAPTRALRWGGSAVERQCSDREPRTCGADVIRHVLDAGYRVFEARDADEALRLFEANPDIRLLFTDVGMPGSMSGSDLACRVAER